MIAVALKRFRDKLGYSQTGIAESVGMKQTTWSGWEKDPPDAMEWLVRLSRRHGVSMEYILGETDDPTPIVRLDTSDLNEEKTKYISSEWLSPLQQDAMEQIAQTLKAFEMKARESVATEMMRGAMIYVEEWMGIEAADEFYQAIDLLRRTGDDSALTGWLARYFGDDDSQNSNE